jgi:hypothetical protein
MRFCMSPNFSSLEILLVGISRAYGVRGNTLLKISAEPSGLMILGAVIFVGGLALRRLIISLSRRISSDAPTTQRKEAW